MKKILLYITVLTILFTGCNNESNIKIKELDESLIKWKNLKDINGTSYKYSVSIAKFATNSNKTIIIINNDSIAEREYYEWDLNGSEIINWVENTSDILGTHAKGAPLKTVDNLYSECKNILNKNNEQNATSLQFDKNGVLAYCSDGRGKVDDYSSTISIKDLIFSQ